MPSVNILTTQEQFDGMHQLADGRATTVKVDKQALLRLLMDHSTLVKALQMRNVTVVEPRERPRIRV